MNVSISQLVEDFDTTVSTIQGVITLYCLVMAMLTALPVPASPSAPSWGVGPPRR